MRDWSLTRKVNLHDQTNFYISTRKCKIASVQIAGYRKNCKKIFGSLNDVTLEMLSRMCSVQTVSKLILGFHT